MSTRSLKGGPELMAYLDGLSRKLAGGALRVGLTAAAKPIREEARRLARKSSGKMAKAIKTGSPRVNQDGSVTVRIYLDPKRDHGFLGYFHEFGVRPHLIKVQEQEKRFRVKRDGRRQTESMKTINRRINRELGSGDAASTVLAHSLVIGQHFVGPVVKHPGHSKQPFMRPAMETKADEAVTAFGKRIRDYIEGKTGFVTTTIDVDDTA